MDVIRTLRPAEAADMYRLIEVRVAWMDQHDIDGWNRNGYLDAYPLPYYVQCAEEGAAYGLWRDGKLAAAAVLRPSDDAWRDDIPARYVHHFVSAPDAPGAGGALLDWLEARARSQGATRLRLDTAIRNAPLNAFYAARGYEPAGFCGNSRYQGILREKWL